MPTFYLALDRPKNCNGRLIVKVRHVISYMGYRDKGVSEKVILKDIRDINVKMVVAPRVMAKCA